MNDGISASCENASSVTLRVAAIDIERPKIDCLSVVMCPLPAQLKTGFFSIFFVAAVYSTTEQARQALSSL